MKERYHGKRTEGGEKPKRPPLTKKQKWLIAAAALLAVALVIFAQWKPVKAIWGSILFGGLYILYLYIAGLGRSMQEIFKMLPYLVTIVVLVLASMRRRREDQPPASLGTAYFREER